MEDFGFADLTHVQHKLRQVLKHFGQGRWRLGEDVLDRAYALVIDRLVRGTSGDRSSPRDLAAYACEVLRNLVRSGPHRITCDRARTKPLPESVSARQPSPRGVSAEHLIPSHALVALTSAESAAVKAVRGAPSMASAAAQVGMSTRDYRNRLSRAAQKIRHVLGQSRPPLPPLTLRRQRRVAASLRESHP
jgi:DNA-directed RNA polymerase specialized sigma24 family protein